MPTTRKSTNKATAKAYYSKKGAPYQQHFPHRRKLVRRPETHDDGGKKQLKFLPEMMRRGTVQDSDEEGGELLEEEEEAKVICKGGRNRRKRNSGVMREGSEEKEEEEEVVQPTKRRRKSAEHNDTSRNTRRRGRPTPVESASEESSVSEETEETKPRLRRQSTMTQIMNGRSPAPGSLDPDFKPIKRTQRTSWGGKGTKPDAKKDLKQRTLTQMVHTMTPLVPDSDDEPPTETDEEADAAHHSFIFGDSKPTAVDSNGGDQENDPPAETSLPTTSDSQDEYHPTQFIDAPLTKTRRTPLRSARRPPPSPHLTSNAPPKPRFALLPTPEKRRIREIPSSQSPPNTPLSTQHTPRRSGRTPSKGGKGVPGKQVTFMNGPQEKMPRLRKFASTIPDSEEEEGGWSDEEGDGEEGQEVLLNEGDAISGVDVGVETQAVLFEIDRACANVDGDVESVDRGRSEELGERRVHSRGEVSQEPGGGIERYEGSTSSEDMLTETLELPPLPFSSPKARDDNADAELSTDIETPPVIQAFPSSPPIEDFRTRSPTPMFNDDDEEEEEEEEEEDEDEDPTILAAPSHSPQNPPRSTPPFQDFLTNPPIPMFNDSTSLPSSTPPPLATGTTLHSIQVPRSPPHIKTEPSHSSQAEHQLHSEQERYSQYRRPHPPPSSMHVAHDPTYSYQATPRPAPLPPSHASTTLVSQATTIDPTQPSPRVTPRKLRVKPPMFVSPSRVPRSSQKHDRVDTTPKTGRQRGGSAPATPKSARVETLSMSSPETGRPAPLFIPSSFPSPARVTMEGWSSPVGPVRGRYVGESQWGMGSLEDFSIPAPPPGSSQWVDEE